MSIHRPATIPTYTGKIIDYGRLYLTSILGRGSFGIVYKAIDLQDSAQTAYAVKWVGHPGDQQDACGADYLNSEADNHSMVCDHPNIVTLHRVIDDRRRNCRWLVMAYIPGGPLIDAITTRHAFWRNETRARSVCFQLVSAVQHCHARGVYHRDIKPENVLLSDDANTVYLADFGLSTRADRSTSSSGTAAYMAPEQLNAQERERGYSCAATDVWALMITLFNLLTGHSPWDRANEYCDDYMAFLGFPDQHVLERSFPVSRDFERVFTDYTEHTPAHRQGLDHLCDHLGTMTMFPTWVRPGVGPVAKRLDDLSMAHYDHELAQYNAYLQDLESDACKPAIFIPVACASSLSSDIALALCALPDSIFPSGHSGADDFIKVCSDTDKIAPDPEQVVSRHISWSSSAPESCSLPSLTPVLLDPFRDPTSTSSGPDTPEHAAADVAVHDGHVSYLGLDYSCTHEAVGKDNNLVHASLMIC